MLDATKLSSTKLTSSSPTMTKKPFLVSSTTTSELSPTTPKTKLSLYKSGGIKNLKQAKTLSDNRRGAVRESLLSLLNESKTIGTGRGEMKPLSMDESWLGLESFLHPVDEPPAPPLRRCVSGSGIESRRARSNTNRVPNTFCNDEWGDLCLPGVDSHDDTMLIGDNCRAGLRHGGSDRSVSSTTSTTSVDRHHLKKKKNRCSHGSRNTKRSGGKSKSPKSRNRKTSSSSSSSLGKTPANAEMAAILLPPTLNRSRSTPNPKSRTKMSTMDQPPTTPINSSKNTRTSTAFTTSPSRESFVRQALDRTAPSGGSWGSLEIDMLDCEKRKMEVEAKLVVEQPKKQTISYWWCRRRWGGWGSISSTIAIVNDDPTQAVVEGKQAPFLRLVLQRDNQEEADHCMICSS